MEHLINWNADDLDSDPMYRPEYLGLNRGWSEDGLRVAFLKP